MRREWFEPGDLTKAAKWLAGQGVIGAAMRLPGSQHACACVVRGKAAAANSRVSSVVTISTRAELRRFMEYEQ